MSDKGCITVKASFDEPSDKGGIKMMLGRNYKVYPMTMMVEGAYYPNVDCHDKPSALYFDGSDLQKSVPSWNGRPVSLNHPDGQTTCNDPAKYDQQWLGHVFNARYEGENRKLKADLWLDNERGNEIAKRVESGDQLDVSIGAFGDIINDPGVANGVHYNERMINISGDHLAVLPDSRGACSWSDGCGIKARAFIGCERKMEKTNSEDSKNSKDESSLTYRHEKSGVSSEKNDTKGEIMEETVEKKAFDKEEVISSLPEHVQDVVRAAMSKPDVVKAALTEAKATFDENVDKIVSCESTDFERDDFHLIKGLKMSTMSLVKKIASLVDRCSEAEKKVKALEDGKNCCDKENTVNYGVKAMGDKQEIKLDYAKPKDIDWSN